MPLEMNDPDGDASPYPRGPRFGEPAAPWWRPASTAGRVFFGFCALILLGALGTGAFLLKTYLDRDPRFRIAGTDNIQATGLTEVSRAEMLPVFGEDIGRNIFFVPLAERRKQLEAIPWVERATVMRLLPDRIRVSVVERQPVAFVRQGQEIGLVDASGVLLTMPPSMMAQRHYSFPVVTGIDPRDPLPSRRERMAVYQRLLAELDTGNQRFSEQISEIDLTDPEDARVLMPEQGTDILAHFGEDHFLERYQRYEAHIAEWRQQYPKLAAVDLRYDQQVVLSMAPGDPSAQPAAVNQSAVNPGEAKPSSDPPAGSAQEASASSEKPEIAAKPSARAKQAGPAGSASVRSRTAAAKEKAVKDKKKRAEARRAALYVIRRRNALRYRPPAVASEGQ